MSSSPAYRRRRVPNEAAGALMYGSVIRLNAVLLRNWQILPFAEMGNFVR